MRFASEAQDWARKVTGKVRDVATARLERVRAERRHEAPPDKASDEPPGTPPEPPVEVAEHDEATSEAPHEA